MPINIRPETPADIQAIHQVTEAAFLNVEHADHTEQFIVKALRDAGALTISLVAEEDDQIIGHVAISPVSISDGAEGWCGLGPISVAPDQQGKGIGSALMNAAINDLKELNANGCVLLGEPAYYRRFGFKSIEGLILPEVPPEYFQALLFNGEYPQGEVSYHEGFYVQANQVNDPS
jgi:putative acetyltransferase